MRARPVLTLLVMVAVLFSLAPRALAQGGGLILYENGSSDMGSSYAGAAARAQDAGTVFTNPAGMTRLDGNNIQLGTMAIFTDFELELGPGTVSVPPGSFNGGGDLNQFAPGLGSFGTFSISDDFKVGFAVTALAANGVEYNRSWVGRSFIIQNDFIAANFQPTVAYRLNEQFSIGAGLNVVYMALDQELLANDLVGAPTVEIDDADDVAFGYTLGLMYEASESTRFGFYYREELEFDLSGDIDTIVGVPITFDTEMKLPRGINLSMYHAFNDTWALLADVGWSDWSTFDKMPTTVSGMGFNIPRDWDDTWRVGGGLEYRFGEGNLLRGGISYDSSPVDDDKRLPDIPVGEQWRFSVGYQHDFGEGKIFGATYTMIYTPMDVTNVALPNGAVLNGEYDPSFLHILGLTFTLQY
ncbi:MAG: OmpP1/FadL family transporter [Planctomycetota bacterium]|jgi:long-chain fatty acid transport protein